MQGNKSVWGFFFPGPARAKAKACSGSALKEGEEGEEIDAEKVGNRIRRAPLQCLPAEKVRAPIMKRSLPAAASACCCCCVCSSSRAPAAAPAPVLHVPARAELTRFPCLPRCATSPRSLPVCGPSSPSPPTSRRPRPCRDADTETQRAPSPSSRLISSRPLGSHGPNMRASSRAQCVRTCGVRGRGCSAATPPPPAVGTCARIYGESNGRRRPARRPPRHATATRTRTTTPPATVTTTTAAAACRCFSRAVRAAPRARKSDAMPMRDALHCT